MIKAVVLDVGETLVDETRIWSRWADRLAVPRFALLGVIGGMAALDRPATDALALVRPGFDLEAEEAAWERDDPRGLRNHFDAGDLYPDVRDALAALREAGYQVVIAGNQPSRAYDALVAMDLPADSVHTSEGWGVAKPAPEFFARVAEVAGVEPEAVLYVGDRLDNDVLPAARAGMRTALLRRGPWGYLHAARPEAAAADLVVDDLHGLLPGLRDLT
ncbi:HAD family hydrolase [Nonomuraea pusilla]|uniref:Haloacid dehalogenase superfamily, subfamily IA, variant 3 with third motif having DD or ED/haloacid dehalogenase superfamily, subfamily IA, variant 1 with third motif having Dx(3-4)D or Dx(3-4)E n=1 Tax=Nonomuraea pusilla TaxID=46177 RepID=A0A1H7M493_9ACTN|nr:HAD family hydrolase [Nonomuraea pusilla]SEL05407.1 haloacid dehalogenase superfamily, subfamily IA, variant 3 with third motif having DD or ED/haloacid dehalogenase superfamily, subfamily IA, variant 1 with third motif having Dx(3-4)D or Dx(3-4)E [Nonomuraea pusilla]